MSGYIDVSNLKITKDLQDNWRPIRVEVIRLFGLIGDVLKPNGPMMGQNGRYVESMGVDMYSGENYSTHLWVHPEMLDDREKEICFAPGVPEKRVWRQQQCPTLTKILKPYAVRGLLGNVGINKLMPGSKINPHYGVSSAFFRMHLGLETDPGATFYIKDEPSYTWKDGEVMAFRDGDVLHWVEHNGTKRRIIIAIDLRDEVLKETI
mgnify:CR=1 FL=1